MGFNIATDLRGLAFSSLIIYNSSRAITMFRAIEHTAIATPDPEKLAAWYVDILGFRINHRYGPNVFVRAPDGGVIELIPADNGDRPEQRMFQAGIRHLAVTVDDFDAAHHMLQSRGVKFLTE